MKVSQQLSPAEMRVHGGGESSILVSVVMPVFNGARYLGAAIQSLLEQTLAEFELIVVDDGSTDETPAIVERFLRQDQRLRFFRSPRNLGISLTLNRGLAVARGIFIARMDADDVALPHRLARQVSFLEEHPEIALVGTAMRYIDENGTVIGTANCVTGWEKIQKIVHLRSPAAHPTWMFRRSLLSTLGGYRNNPPAEDYDFVLRLITNGGRIDNIPDVSLLHRIAEGNTVSERALEQQLAIEYVLRLYHQRRRRGHDDFSETDFARAVKASAASHALHRLSLVPYRTAFRYRSQGMRLRSLALYALSALLSPYQLKHIIRGYVSKRRIERSRLLTF